MSRAFQEVQVERATLVEADMAYAIVAEYYEALRVVARETPDEFLKAYFASGSGMWLAWAGPDLAGCIALREMSKRDAAEIKRMYVREPYRGLGIAQQLLAEAERFARDVGYRRIFLDSTSEMQAAIRLYERNGYEHCERYNTNPQATVFMRKEVGQR